MENTREKTSTPKKELPPEELKGVKDVIQSFLIAIKNYGLYPEDHVTVKKFLSNIQNSLDVFLKKFVKLRLIISRDSFLYKDQTVHKEESSQDSLPLFLHREGIQWIEFQGSPSSDEILTFLKIINQYKTQTADPEGDLVTALWEADLPNIRYEASNTLQGGEESIFSFALMSEDVVAQIPHGEVFARGEIPPPGVLGNLQHQEGAAIARRDGADTGMTSVPAEELSGQLSVPGSGAPAAGGEGMEGEVDGSEPTGAQEVLQAKTISIADPAVDRNLMCLTEEEQETLKQMVHVEEKIDSKNDVVELLMIILKEETNQQNFSTILQYLEEEFQDVLQYDDFGFAYHLLKSLNKRKQISSGEEGWVQEKMEKFLHNISSLGKLGILLEVKEKIEKLDIDQLTLLARILVSLKPTATETLWAFMLKGTTERISQLFVDIIVLHAKKDITPLTNLLETDEEADLLIAAKILRKIEGSWSTAILLKKMITHPSVKVRQQALEALIKKNLRDVKKLYPLLTDRDLKIRVKLLNFLGQGENTEAEDMLLRFISNDLQNENDEDIILSFYRALGRCGSSRSIPYLKEKLFAKSWKMLLKMDSQTAHREGAACALAAMNNAASNKILKEAAESSVSQIRSAYKEALNK